MHAGAGVRPSTILHSARRPCGDPFIIVPGVDGTHTLDHQEGKEKKRTGGDLREQQLRMMMDGMFF